MHHLSESIIALNSEDKSQTFVSPKHEGVDKIMSISVIIMIAVYFYSL